MINWGVIGAGGIAYRRTIPEGIIKAKNANLIGITDIDSAASEKIGKEFSVTTYKNIDELLKDEKIDAVYIATPIYLHHEQTIRAARNKKNILCEKVMALDQKQCYEMLKACDENKVKFAVGFMMRFNAAHIKIKEIVKNGKLGKIVMARAQLSCWYPQTEGAWRQKKKLSMGGTLTDMGAHCLDILEYIMGTNITDVSCFTGNIVHDYEVEDSSLVTARFGNGAFGVIDNYFNIPDLTSKNILEIYGSKGSVLCRGTIGQESSGTCEIYLEDKEAGYSPDQKRKDIIKKEILDIHYENIYEKEIEYFSDCIEKNIQPRELSGSIGLHNIKIIEACYDSANTSRQKKVL